MRAFNQPLEQPRGTTESPARRVAVLVPCYNEEAAIAQVVEQFHAALPGAVIYVYDNNSKDGTAAAARAAGAIVGMETRQGKGHVVCRMFADVEADIYVLVDGDATYDAPSAPTMIEKLVDENLDMVVGSRVDQEHDAYRLGHRSGNRLLTWFVAEVFGSAFSDILSGYRVFSRRFVKSFPALSSGFEIETELTIHALELGMPVGEVKTPYYARPEGSASKLNTWRDGYRAFCGRSCSSIAWSGRCRFFGVIAVMLAALSDRARGAGGGHVPRTGRGAAAADRDPFDRADAARLPRAHLRPRARHGDARPARIEAARLSIAPRALRLRAPRRLHDRIDAHQRPRADFGGRGDFAARAGIDCHVADRHMSAVEGSIGALPRRILVASGDAARARKILQEAGYGHALAAS